MREELLVARSTCVRYADKAYMQSVPHSAVVTLGPKLWNAASGRRSLVGGSLFNPCLCNAINGDIHLLTTTPEDN